MTIWIHLAIQAYDMQN